MLKFTDYRTKTKGLPDLLPYAALVEPGVILNKDGSFTAGWVIRGQDTASSTEKDLSTVSSRFNTAVKLLGSGWMLHVDAIRSSHSAYPDSDKGHFPDPVTRLIDEERREFFSGNRCFSTSAILTVTYKPNFQAAKLAGKAQAGVATSGALEKVLIYFQNMLEELEDALSAVLYMDRLLEYSMPDADSEDWLQSDLLSHIQHCVSG